MDLEELFPSKPGDPLTELAKQDLDPMSIEELHARIEALKAEIARVEAQIEPCAGASISRRRAVQKVMLVGVVQAQTSFGCDNLGISGSAAP